MLSGGNQQKVVLAKWLLTDARILLLDEPTRGVDVAAKKEIYATIADLAARGMGILLISSELPEMLGMCDRTLVMREGRLVGEFTREQATEEKILAGAAGGAEAIACRLRASRRASRDGGSPAASRDWAHSIWGSSPASSRCCLRAPGSPRPSSPSAT